MYFNDAAPTYIGTNVLAGLSGSTLSGNTVIPVKGYMTLVPGLNYINIICYNSLYSQAGLIASFYSSNTINNSTTSILRTNNTWKSRIVSVANPINNLATVVKGGLNTTIYYNGTNSFTYNNDITANQNQSYYYSTYNQKEIISRKIINNFLSISNIDSYTNYWGFKASGFFVPTSSGSWNFKLSSDDSSQLWIGDGLGINGVNTTNIATVPSSDANVKAKVSVNETTLTLTANIYYPILIFYGQQSGPQSFNLDISNNGASVLHSNLLYYVNYNFPSLEKTKFIFTNAYSVNGIIGSSNNMNTLSNYSSINQTSTSGTLYKFISGTDMFTNAYFTMTEGYMNCYFIMVTQGSIGSKLYSGAGGSAIFGYFNIVPKLKYQISFTKNTDTIAVESGLGTGSSFFYDGESVSNTSIRIYNPIQDRDSFMSSNSYLSTFSGVSSYNGVSSVYKFYSGGRYLSNTNNNLSGNNGYTIQSNDLATPTISQIFSDMSTLIGNMSFGGGGGIANQSGTGNGDGGSYNVGGKSYNNSPTGNTNGTGYGTGGGMVSSTSTTASLPGGAVFYLYLNKNS